MFVCLLSRSCDLDSTLGSHRTFFTGLNVSKELAQFNYANGICVLVNCCHN